MIPLQNPLRLGVARTVEWSSPSTCDLGVRANLRTVHRLVALWSRSVPCLRILAHVEQDISLASAFPSFFGKYLQKPKNQLTCSISATRRSSSSAHENGLRDISLSSSRDEADLVNRRLREPGLIADVTSTSARPGHSRCVTAQRTLGRTQLAND